MQSYLNESVYTLIYKHGTHVLRAAIYSHSSTINHTVFIVYNSPRTIETMTYNAHFVDSPIIGNVAGQDIGRVRE